MQLVVADSLLLHRLHSQGISKEFCTEDHSFKVADLAWRDLAQDVQVEFAPIIRVEHLEPAQTRRMTELFRAQPTLCVGEAASIVLAEASESAILTGSLTLAIPATFRWEVCDMKWVEAHLSPRIGTERFENFLNGFVGKH